MVAGRRVNRVAETTKPSGPDFALGIQLADIPPQGTLAGRVGDQPVLLSRFDGELFAVSGSCTHYGASLASGLIDGEAVRCPLHHACFDLKTGAALRTPALDGLDRWRVDVDGSKALVTSKLDERPVTSVPSNSPEDVIIIGGGAASLACASELRRLGYRRAITMLSADPDAPYDRPNLSKDYLAGSAAEEWLPLRSDGWYPDNAIDLRLDVEVIRIDPGDRTVHLASGELLPFDRLLIATGSEANHLALRGFDLANVFKLRSVSDCRAIIEQAAPGRRAAIIGSSFIGLEAAAALRAREVDVTVVSPEQVPFERVLGAELGTFLLKLHEKNGVRFHLGRITASFDGSRLNLADGTAVEADFVLVGIGARPRTKLAEAAGLAEPGRVPVNEYLETRVAGIYAAGDVAAYPEPISGEPVRVEHWVHAQRQGQTAAANMLGLRQRFDAVPFFWTEQYGVAVRYVGHAGAWDVVAVDGSLDGGEFVVRYLVDGVHRATASVGRDRDNLADEQHFEAMIREIHEKRPPSREPAREFVIE
jgi:NADPH-dependent 2,4-dienoyl-CoA reductase/sulfur reductase-like enzyme/nitrite reductase/ring-hydroxylating ferredoxin subunit